MVSMPHHGGLEMGKKILVVDNDRFMLTFLTDLLTERGHEVKTAMDGLAALEVLKTYIPDVVFLDLIMPNISGDKLCRMIRKNPDLQHAYIAIVSATVAEEPTRFAELGANTCIAKGPLDEISRQVQAALEEAGRAASAPVEAHVPDFSRIARRGITQELLSVQRHLGTLLNNISEGILELNDAGNVIFANNVALSMFGGAEEKLLGQRFIDLFEEAEALKIDQVLKDIGSGLPETIDPFSVRVNGERLLIKILPVEDNLSWSVMVIAIPIHKIPCPSHRGN